MTATIARLAKEAVACDRNLLTCLRERREALGLSIEAVAERMSVPEEDVVAFERYDANPQLSTIRRYALAVGAFVEHRVVSEADL